MSEFNDDLIGTRTEHLSVFGELVKYKPLGGGERTIVAAVTRGRPDGLDGAPYGHAPLTTIHVENNNTTGIASGEVDTGGDLVEVAVRLGETVEDRRITKIIQEDAGMLELELR